MQGLGRTNVFNIRDDFSPVKIGSSVYPCNKWDDRQVQDALHQELARPLSRGGRNITGNKEDNSHRALVFRQGQQFLDFL